jgi:cysteinyl-tRNA synthetase
LITYSNFRQVVASASRKDARPSKGMLAALADDLNTPAAITELHHLVARARSFSADDAPADAADELVGSLLLLGFDRAVDHVKYDDQPREEAVREFHEVSAREAGLDTAQIKDLVDARNAARKAKNFKDADRLRDELTAMGIELEDKKDGTTDWKVKR